MKFINLQHKTTHIVQLNINDKINNKLNIDYHYNFNPKLIILNGSVAFSHLDDWIYADDSYERYVPYYPIGMHADLEIPMYISKGLKKIKVLYKFVNLFYSYQDGNKKTSNKLIKLLHNLPREKPENEWVKLINKSYNNCENITVNDLNVLLDTLSHIFYKSKLYSVTDFGKMI